MFFGGKGKIANAVTEVESAVSCNRNGWLRLAATETVDDMPAETEIGRVTLKTPNPKLSYGVEARKTVLPCRS